MNGKCSMPKLTLVSLVAFLLLTPPASRAEDGPEIIVMAAAKNPQPGMLPTIRVVKEKMWGKYYPIVSTSFPNVPDFTCDSWCYESGVDFVDARSLEGGKVEMRHRPHKQPGVFVLTTVTPEPEAVEFEARMALDPARDPDARLPDVPTGLNLCWQLRHAPGFASQPDSYPKFVERCFIFTDQGRTFLHDLDRKRIPAKPADHEHNNPPWVQSYVGMWQQIPKVNQSSWADYSADRYVTTVMGAVSRDRNYLTAIANDSATTMCQAWHDCMHNNPQWLPENAPVVDQRWRLKIYALKNDPKALLARVGNDFPNAKHLDEANDTKLP